MVSEFNSDSEQARGTNLCKYEQKHPVTIICFRLILLMKGKLVSMPWCFLSTLSHCSFEQGAGGDEIKRYRAFRLGGELNVALNKLALKLFLPSVIFSVNLVNTFNGKVRHLLEGI
jgi:hypothetical protein